MLLTYKGQTRILHYLHLLKKCWRSSAEELERHRINSLKLMLEHADESSLFHNQRFKEAALNPRTLRRCDELSVLPFMTKDDLNNSIDLILSNRFRHEELDKSSTGGSSGLPLTFYRDREVTCVRRAQDYFFNSQIGIHHGAKRAWVWGSPQDAYQFKSLKSKLGNFLNERAIYFYSFDATAEKMSEFLENWRIHKPAAVFAYPNMMATLAEFIKEKGVKGIVTPRVVVTAEPLYQWQRDLFKEVFSAETFERYGSREIGTVASELRDHDGMYICEPHYYLEIVDRDGKQVSPGEMGELIVTDLHNFAMPLIRYRTGDMVRIEEAKSSADSRWRRITAVGGRIVDMVIRQDGVAIAGEALIMALRTAGVRNKVQLVQHDPISMTIRHLYSEVVLPEIRGALQKAINEMLGGEVAIEYSPVAELPYDSSGKYRYITCEYRKSEHAVDR